MTLIRNAILDEIERNKITLDTYYEYYKDDPHKLIDHETKKDK